MQCYDKSSNQEKSLAHLMVTWRSLLALAYGSVRRALGSWIAETNFFRILCQT
jgi:hypothetical protein